MEKNQETKKKLNFLSTSVNKDLMKLLSPSFFKRPTVEVAQGLLGKYLIHETTLGPMVGKIVETEAYLHNDPACHASRGQTRRTQPMFGPPGGIYIYFIYGMYYCLNIVTSPQGIGEAVLLRALEPIEGISLMEQNRNTTHLKALCSGPAKLVLAMGIKPQLNNTMINQGSLKIASDGKVKPKIVTTTRIGISCAQDLKLRYYIAENAFVSKK